MLRIALRSADPPRKGEGSRERASSYPFAFAALTEGSGITLTPGGGTSSSGTKKSDISGEVGSTR